MMMTDPRVVNIDELKAFLASSDVLTFKGSSREETYGWIERTLRTYSYFSRPRSEKGLIRSYMQKITGMSAAGPAVGKLRHLKPLLTFAWRLCAMASFSCERTARRPGLTSCSCRKVAC